MRYEIAIPTFERYATINSQTLALLARYNVPHSQIRIFIENEAQLALYDLDDEYSIQITGAKGIMDTRNYLRHYYQESDLDFVVFLDDNLKEIIEKVDDKTVKNIADFDKLVMEMARTTKEVSMRLCGICAADNPFFMKNKITTNLKYICGNFQILIIDKTKPIILTDVGQFEDMVFSMEHFLADGGVVRYMNYAVLTKYFQTGGQVSSEGGIEKRYEYMRKNAPYLVNKYPNMCREIIKKNYTNLRLNYHFKIP